MEAKSLFTAFCTFSRAHADLPHAIARDAEFVGELLERDRIIGKAARLENSGLAIVEHHERSPSAVWRFSDCSDSARRLSWLALSSSSQSIHFAGIAAVVDRRTMVQGLQRQSEQGLSPKARD
jgi:hypothetical protein